jgi:hypothetical protein
LKNIVTLLLMPLTVCLRVFGVGISLLWVRRRIGAAKIVPIRLGVSIMDKTKYFSG